MSFLILYLVAKHINFHKSFKCTPTVGRLIPRVYPLLIIHSDFNMREMLFVFILG